VVVFFSLQWNVYGTPDAYLSPDNSLGITVTSPFTGKGRKDLNRVSPPHYYIIAHGDYKGIERFQSVLKEKGSFIIGANGGAAVALELGVLPQVVIGDGDSLDPQIRRHLEAMKVEFIDYPPEKDKTDTQLALEYCIAHGAKKVTIIGAIGGRLDHSLANVFLLVLAKGHGINARIIDGAGELFLLKAESITLEGQPGDYLSLIPLTGKVTGVSGEGLKYPLYQETLYSGQTRSISNELLLSQIKIEVKEGMLLLYFWHKHIS
jgi:thiamine pyrophosphokinase